MKIFVFLVFIFLSKISYGAKDCTHEKKAFRCVQYVKNYDADTLTVNIPNIHPLIGHLAKIRVAHIDTPELRTKDVCEKKLAQTARDFVRKELLKAKRIDLNNIKKGKYFRVVSDVIIDGKNLGDILIKKGFAYPYEGGKKEKINWCKAVREIAGRQD